MAKPEEALVGKTIGGCRIASVIGGGGMGVVYRAIQERLRAPVALKVIRSAIGQDERIIARFEREAREIAKLRGKTPHVVQIYDFGWDDDVGVYYISMELVEGEGVDRVLRKRGAIAEAEAAAIIRQAALGLEEARQLEIVHRDMKPENLLLTKAGVVKITDFGLAKGVSEVSQQMTASGQILGTPAYMSPEQAEAQPVDHRSDIYSLGATLYALVTGGTPYKADTPVAMALQHIRAPVPDARGAGAAVSAGLNAVMMKMMAKGLTDRYQTAGEVAVALEAFLKASTPEHAIPPSQTLSLLVDAPVAPPTTDEFLVVADPSAVSDLARQSKGGTPSAAAPMAGGRTPTPITMSASAARTPTPAPPAGGISRGVLVAAGLVLVLGGGTVGVLVAMSGGGDKPGGGGPVAAAAPAAARLRLQAPEKPEPDAILTERRVAVRGRIVGTPDGAWVRVDGAPARLTADLYSTELTLAEGAHDIQIEVGVGNESHHKLAIPVRVDVDPPALAITEPRPDGPTVRSDTARVAGTVTDATPVEVTIDGKRVEVVDGRFGASVSLREGENPIVVEARDQTGKTSKSNTRVTRDTTPPQITLEGEGSVVEDPAFVVRGRAPGAARATIGTTEVSVAADGAFEAAVTLGSGRNTLTVEAADALGNKDSRPLTVTVEPLPEGLTRGTEPGTFVWARDGAVMVRVPGVAGRVWIDREEVGVARYRHYLDAAGEAAAAHRPKSWANQSGEGRDGYPVVGVSWDNAGAYATWAGKALPTEAEWVAAAGGEGRAWPWGDAAPTETHAVFGRDTKTPFERAFEPAGGREAGRSPCGAWDLAGNVAEWCADAADPKARKRIVKGGSWTEPADDCKVAARRREAPTERMYTLGFRCVLRDSAASRGSPDGTPRNR